AVTIDIIDTTSLATVATGIHLTSTTGKIELKSSDNTDSLGTSNGSATLADTVGVGVAVTVNLVQVVNEASAAAGSVLSAATTLTLDAAMTTVGASDTTHSFNSEATSGASATGTVGIAGSLALSLIDVETIAVLHSTSTASATGNVSFSAASKVDSKQKAIA